MTIPYHEQLGRVFNTPLLATPQKASTIGAFLLKRVDAKTGHGSASDVAIEESQHYPLTEHGDGSVTMHSPRMSRFHGEYLKDENGRPSLYRVKDRVAILTVIGSLVNRGAWVGASSGLVSYEGFMHQITTAAEDSRVDSILVDIDSPGGEATGCFEAAAAVRKAAEKKPVYFLANSMCCSAAYGLASGATKRYIIASGIGGSIGVVLMHLDFSVYLHNEGVKPTLIHAGAHKVDGNPYEPLPADVRSDLQSEVNQFYDLFVGCVAEGTGLSEKAIRATQARTYIGAEAVKVGLFDQVATIEEILASLTPPKPAEQASTTITVAKATASKENDMSLWNQLKEALGGGPAPAAETPALSNAPANITPITEDASPPAVLHVITGGATKCGATGEFTADVALEDATCAGCVRAEYSAREAQGRTARIDADVKAFEAKCANIGKGATTALVSRYRAAQQAGDAVAIADCETIASSFPAPGAAGRLTDQGPSADALAGHAKTVLNDPGAEAARRVKARGISEKSPKWSAEYSAEVAKVKGEMGVAGGQ